jgi:Phytanoyl-CoA dioxygenase (PhyH)
MLILDKMRQLFFNGTSPSTFDRSARALWHERDGLAALRRQLIDAFPDYSASVSTMMAGYDEFAQAGETPPEAYQAFRQLYCDSKGRSNAMVGDYIASLFPPEPVAPRVRSILGNFTANEVRNIARDITETGFHRFASAIPAALISRLKLKLDAETAKLNGEVDHSERLGRTTFSERYLIQIEEVTAIASDPLIRSVVGQSMRTSPVLSYVSSWISRAHDNQNTTMNETAQLFHFDMSNPGFLKVFIYLTDVTDATGPHCMVPGSHRQRNDSLWRDGRISDDEMAQAYPRETWAVLLGKSGSIFIVDTSAFHKGLPVIQGERHILQFYYVNTLFGEHVPLRDIDAATKADTVLSRRGTPARFRTRLVMGRTAQNRA